MRLRGGWTTRWGFYFAAVGSAFGLGNVWRFPYIVGSSGGGAFVFFYVLTAILIGLPLLVAELVLGKQTRKSVVTALETMDFEPSRGGMIFRKLRLGWIVGQFSFGASLILMSYYAVISGWVLYFLTRFFFAIFQAEPAPASSWFRTLMDTGWIQIVFSGLHLFACTWIVGRDVQQGIERWVGYLVPVFGVLLIYLTFQSVQLPGAEAALRFLFYPDFSALRFDTFIKAIGHVLFTLSLSLGAMVVFGSYLKEEENLPTAGLRVTLLDTFVSLLIGVLIFPIVFTGGLKVESGPTLVFETLPILISKVGLSEFVTWAFFLCLYIAACGASIGLLETVVSHQVDRKKTERRRAAQNALVWVLLLSVIPALSSNILKSVTWSKMSLLQTFDSVLIHWILPLIGLGTALLVGFGLKMKALRSEFLWDERTSTQRLFLNWIIVLRWFVPAAILVAFILAVVGKISL